MMDEAQPSPPMVEVLYFDGCPNHERLLEHLPALLEGAGVDAELVLTEVPDDERAQAMRFLGSPTVRVNGLDIEPGSEQRTDFGLKCRIYRGPEGLSGIPTDQWLLHALAGAA